MEKINTDYKRRTEKFRLNFSSRSSFDTLQHFTVSRTEVLLLCHDCYLYIVRHWFTRYTYKLKSKILPDQSIEFFFSFTGTYVSNGWTQLDSYTSQCSDEELECMLAAFSCFTFQAELCAVPYLVKKKTNRHTICWTEIFFRQSAMYVIFRLLRPVTCLPAFVSLFYISLQSSSEFFYHPSCGCNFKLL